MVDRWSPRKRATPVPTEKCECKVNLNVPPSLKRRVEAYADRNFMTEAMAWKYLASLGEYVESYNPHASGILFSDYDDE